MLHLRIPLAQAYLWVCPQCQSSWAVLDSPQQDWTNRGITIHLFLHILCKACGGGMLTGGNWAAGLNEDDFEALLNCLPPAELVREALSYLEELFNGNYTLSPGPQYRPSSEPLIDALLGPGASATIFGT